MIREEHRCSTLTLCWRTRVFGIKCRAMWYTAALSESLVCFQLNLFTVGKFNLGEYFKGSLHAFWSIGLLGVHISHLAYCKPEKVGKTQKKFRLSVTSKFLSLCKKNWQIFIFQIFFYFVLMHFIFSHL